MSTFCRYISFAFITFLCGSCVLAAPAPAPALDVDVDVDDASVTTMDQIGIQIETVHKNSSTDSVSRDDNIVIAMNGDAEADMLMMTGNEDGELEDGDNTNIISTSSGNYGYGENLLNSVPTIAGNHEGNNDAFNSSDDLIYLDTKTVHDASVTNLYTSASPASFYEDEGDDGEEDDTTPIVVNGPIDFSEFIGLIPKEQVQNIVSNYLRTDGEVRNAYEYLNSLEFSNIKVKILGLPEVNNFLKFSNESGFDLISFINAIVEITAKPADESSSFSTTTQTPNSKPPSNEGLAALVDSVLDVLPQDEILSLFFDKLETNKEFSYLVKNVGSEKFGKILRKMGDSRELQYLIYVLHNNGINVARIVGILKAYFFLG